MKFPLIFLFLFALLSLSCASEYKSRSVQTIPSQTAKDSEQAILTDSRAAAEPFVPQAQTYANNNVAGQKVSLSQADHSKLVNEAVDRKIIRNAELSLEVESPSEAQHRITSIAESQGGFVVTSEAKQRENIDPSKRTLDIKLVIRIPSDRFGPTLDQIKKLASNLPAENVTGQDVTEDFIDLEARIRTQKALELQFVEIMKQAKKVEDALEVQRQIAEVRTEIERLEGRKRFLENRSSLSTITVNIQAPKVIAVNPTGVGHSIRDAVSDSLELASGMLVFFVRFLIMAAPVFVFVLLPLGLVFRYVVRRAKRMRLPEPLANSAVD